MRAALNLSIALLFLPGATGATELPALEPVDVEAVLPDPLWPQGKGGRALPAFATAAEHARALKADPLHGDAFVVEQIAGDPTSPRVVFLIPQFHRHPSIPLTWTTFGKAIVLVQRNIEALMTRLSTLHGVRCVGTEGSWVDNIEVPFELKQAATWARDLERTKKALPQNAAAERVHDVLQAELKRIASIYDGVGMSQVREGARLRRFGLEDAELNRAGLGLLAELKALDEQLARLDPGTQSASSDALGDLWLLEIDDHEREVLGPLRRGLATLDKERVALRQAGGDDAVWRLSRFVSLAKLITERVVELDAIDAHTAYYREVADELSHDAGPPPAPRALSAAEARERARLLKARAPLQARYEATTLAARDRAAVEKLRAKLGASGSCAMVFGMAHQDGLLSALTEKGDLAVVVVAPFDRKALEEGRLD